MGAQERDLRLDMGARCRRAALAQARSFGQEPVLDVDDRAERRGHQVRLGAEVVGDDPVLPRPARARMRSKEVRA
jgi:hypothetical protein